MKLTILARADLTGLGNQSRNWVRLLDPHKVVIINSKPFNKNEQHFEWYSNRPRAYRVDGFIKTSEIRPILSNTDLLITFESVYNYQLLRVARQLGVKTIMQNNWEFTDYLRSRDLPLPDLLVNHSYWHLEDQKKLWPEITDYCPTPLFVEDYQYIRDINMNRTGKRRFLHVAGRQTHQDRNGTNDLLEAVRSIPDDYDFELVIKSQTVDVNAIVDPRVSIDRNSPLDEKELYRDFDAVIMPRRYGGGCLPMNEALAAGLPVIMNDIEPNNIVLPKEWLVPAEVKSFFMARTLIDVYSADYLELAKKIMEFVEISDEQLKLYQEKAYDIALQEYSSDVVLKKWKELVSKLGF